MTPSLQPGTNTVRLTGALVFLKTALDKCYVTGRCEQPVVLLFIYYLFAFRVCYDAAWVAAFREEKGKGGKYAMIVY